MAKKIKTIVLTGGILANTLGVVPVGAYSGETTYPENKKTHFVVTMVDVRNNKFSAFFYRSTSVFKGARLFGGEIDDTNLEKITEHTTKVKNEYFKYDFYMDSWEDIPSGEERTFNTSANLAANTPNTLAFTFLYWTSATNKNLNIWRGRMNYDRCASSEAYLTNEEAICRAEIWADGVLHYQPYLDWTRLGLADDPEQDFVQVYKNNGWVNERIKEEVLSEPEPEPEPEPESEPVDGGENKDGGGGGELEGEKSNGGEEIKTVEVIKEVPVEVIKEVPVEKVVEKEVEKIVEVPVEKMIEVAAEKRIEVPIEKKTTEIKEVIREVPVFANMLSDDLSDIAQLEVEDKTIETDDDVKDNEAEISSDDVDDVNIDDSELKSPDEIDLPELGREDNAEVNSKLAIFSAGMISAIALLVLVVAFRKKKQRTE